MCPIAFGYSGRDDSLRIIPREEWPRKYQEYLDSRFKWDGPMIEATLLVELPFFLLVPDSTVSVRHDVTTCDLTVHNDYSEVTDGPIAFNSKHNVVAIFREGVQPNIDSICCPVFRPMKTVLEIPVKLLAEVVVAWNESRTLRINRAAHYLHSLALAHIPFINELILAYRAASYDPIAFGVSEWDVPFWYLRSGAELIRISLMPYHDFFKYPVLSKMGSAETNPVFTADETAIRKRLSEGVTPGRREMLDAESLFYRGRYGDAVRAAVTAIEVALEAEITNALKNRGDSDTDVERFLKDTRNSFEKRLSEYERVSKRRVPGPLITIIYYINGIRLKKEIASSRELRHKIVHEGMAIDFHSRGPMLRVIETSRWLFQWLNSYADERREVSAGEFYSQARGLVIDPFEYTTDGVVVRPHGAESEDYSEDRLVENILLKQYEEAVTKDGGDIELFVAMSMEYLGMQQTDAPLEAPDDSMLFERYEYRRHDRLLLVFALECDGVIDAEMIAKVKRRLQHHPQTSAKPVTAWCIINHERFLPLERRASDGAFSDEALAEVDAPGVSAVTAHDLLLIIKGLHSHGWRGSHVFGALSGRGRRGRVPAHYEKIGQFNRTYPKHAVLSFDLDEGVTVRRGDVIGMRLHDMYVEGKIESLQVDRNSLELAVGPCRLGVVTSGEQIQGKRGQSVFLVGTSEVAAEAPSTQTKE